MASLHPYYRKWLPTPKDEKNFRGDGEFIDLTAMQFPPGTADAVALARARFEDRAAAAIRTAAALEGTAGLGPPQIWPSVGLNHVQVEYFPGHFIEIRVPDDAPPFLARDLLELKYYKQKAPTIHLPRSKCLSLLAYQDFFPNNPRIGQGLRAMVSRAVLAASPGWCGTLGPGVDGAPSLMDSGREEGNYDMSEMHLLQMVYRHYDDLSPAARELLIRELLQHGRVHRPGSPESFTSGRNPNDWMRAGFVSPAGLQYTLGETENHILMIVTARYLTNQLLFQRDRNEDFDNRRNAKEDSPSVFTLLLSLLYLMLAGDFSEYNAKSYQSETRWALLNLCTYAYDHEIRLAARMVLDYLSAHMAVSSNALRRMVPFRRRWEGAKARTTRDEFMDVLLLERPAFALGNGPGPTLQTDTAGFNNGDAIRVIEGSRHGVIGRLKYLGRIVGGDTTYLKVDPPFPEGVISDDLVTTPDGGADPMPPYFAMQAGNVWAYATAHAYDVPGFAMLDNGTDLAMEVLSDYRLPPAIHDLFVNDRHRRFFQRLHRTPRPEVGGNRNADNMEIYAGSPSYLITAGGSPGTWAIPPGIGALAAPADAAKEYGAAVTTSFIPTDPSTDISSPATQAADVIQFGHFSSLYPTGLTIHIAFWDVDLEQIAPTNVQNYGVAPDFACGRYVLLPLSLNPSNTEGVEDGVPQFPQAKQGWSFVNKGSAGDGPGYYLAIYQGMPNEFALLEAFDTWLHPGVSFLEFKHAVLQRNAGIFIHNDSVTQYTTFYGNRIDFILWESGVRERGTELLPMQDGNHLGSGAQVLGVTYGDPGSVDALGHAEQMPPQLLNGTIMNSPAPGVVVITNPALGSTLTLDMTDPYHPKRTDTQTGEVEFAGDHHEVWLDFEYDGPGEGDVCRPFAQVSAAAEAVADGGTIRVMPGVTLGRYPIGGGKRFKLVAPIGGVTIGGPGVRLPDVVQGGGISNYDVWVQFDWPQVNRGDVPFLYTTLGEATAAVADGGVVNLQPGATNERAPIGGGKRFTLAAPIAGVAIGVR